MEFKVDRIALKLNLPSWKHIFFLYFNYEKFQYLYMMVNSIISATRIFSRFVLVVLIVAILEANNRLLIFVVVDVYENHFSIVVLPL